MTLERALKLPASLPDAATLEEQPSLHDPRLEEKLEVGNVKYAKAIEYVNGQPSMPLEGGIASNVFEAGTPGALSLQELENSINLGVWNLAIGDSVVSLEVRGHDSSRKSALLTKQLVGSCRLGGK